MNTSQPGDQTVTTIDSGIEFKGVIRIKGNKSVVVRGLVEGEIHSDGSLAVAEGGVIRGAVTALHLEVAGKIESDATVEVHGLLSMKKGGTLAAKKVVYADLDHERGSKLAGELVPMEGRRADDAEVGPKASVAAATAIPGAPGLRTVDTGSADGSSQRPAPVHGVSHVAFQDVPPSLRTGQAARA
jgi:cytoskeletal protein CcmA (bactofilin family)